MIVPPVLDKSGFGDRPLLELIWRRAHFVLSEADQVVFVGYSMPDTDLVSKFLFQETLSDDCEIRVVNLAEDKNEERKIRADYRNSFPNLDYWQFSFEGATTWARELQYWGN